MWKANQYNMVDLMKKRSEVKKSANEQKKT